MSNQTSTLLTHQMSMVLTDFRLYPIHAVAGGQKEDRPGAVPCVDIVTGSHHPPTALVFNLKKRRTIVSKACTACRHAKAKCDDFKVRGLQNASRQCNQWVRMPGTDMF